MDKNESTLTEERTLLEGILHYVSIILRYKKMVFVITAAAMIGVVVFSIITLKLPAEKNPLPNVYQASAKIMFQNSLNASAGMASMLSTFGFDTSSTANIDSSQLALQVIQSKPFIDSVVKEFQIVNKFEIKDYPKTRSRAIISSNSEYLYDRNSSSLSISYTSTDKEFASNIVNYQVQLLEEWFQKAGVSVKTSQLSIMEEKLEELSNSITEIEEQIEKFQIQHGSLDITQLAETQAAILLDLRTSLNQIELEISQYTEYSNIEDPALTVLKTQKNNIINQIKSVESGYLSSDGRKIPSTEELPELALEFAHMQAELELQMQLYQTLSERYEVTKLTAAEESVFTILEYAEVPEEKIGPSRGKLCMIVSIVAFCASIVLALVFNALQGIITDPKTIAIIKGK